jgi:hypothetical protein
MFEEGIIQSRSSIDSADEQESSTTNIASR